MSKVGVVLLSSMLAVACASAPDTTRDEPGLTPASYSTSSTTAVAADPSAAIAAPAEADECRPNIVDRRAALKSGCLNRVERSPMAGKGYNAIGREVKDLKSLCNHMILPKCRRKY